MCEVFSPTSHGFERGGCGSSAAVVARPGRARGFVLLTRRAALSASRSRAFRSAEARADSLDLFTLNTGG